jgi:hypothetical protein
VAVEVVGKRCNGALEMSKSAVRMMAFAATTDLLVPALQPGSVRGTPYTLGDPRHGRRHRPEAEDARTALPGRLGGEIRQHVSGFDQAAS